MRTVRYPSADFPAPPRVSIDVPDDWAQVHAPATTLAARAPVEPGSFTPNVVVTVEHRAADFAVTQALDELQAMAQQRQGDMSEAFTIEVGGREFTGCDISWPDPQVQQILQVHLFHVLEAPRPGGLPYLVQVTGSLGGAEAEERYGTIQQVMSSITVTPWQDGAPGEAASPADA